MLESFCIFLNIAQAEVGIDYTNMPMIVYVQVGWKCCGSATLDFIVEYVNLPNACQKGTFLALACIVRIYTNGIYVA